MYQDEQLSLIETLLQNSILLEILFLYTYSPTYELETMLLPDEGIFSGHDPWAPSISASTPGSYGAVLGQCQSGVPDGPDGYQLGDHQPHLEQHVTRRRHHQHWRRSPMGTFLFGCCKVRILFTFILILTLTLRDWPYIFRQHFLCINWCLIDVYK